MKKLSGDKDYVCISGKPTDISNNLNKIASMYDLTVISSDVQDGMVTIIVERRRKETQPTKP